MPRPRPYFKPIVVAIIVIVVLVSSSGMMIASPDQYKDLEPQEGTVPIYEDVYGKVVPNDVYQP
ncbi:hypothetical protein MH117_09525 [Paenibacillus sp. ACRRX]|uniref:hypothetical protein n=1 Tax=unclassified Paenibacillus TaxID=185978 RepID=UPI001EF73F09|nr:MULTISPECIES: hypothetical protein [unclassified Paenibacillus]MCG7407664.1 hypothetical protein [Paenibacillus sp. ACRRX]MDK8180899.1 hypothetical protein [Paenibacillus sp. UMB4589-SE434]